MLARRLGRPGGERWVAIGHLPELRGVAYDGSTGELTIGAATTLAEVAASPAVALHAPLLAEAAAAAASEGIRSIATIGGNVIDAPSASDPAAAALALDASIIVASTAGRRLVPASTLFAGKAIADPGDIVVALRLRSARRAAWGLERLRTQGRADRPAVTIAVQARGGGGGAVVVRAVAAFLADRPIDLGDLGCASPADLRAASRDSGLGDAVANAIDRAVEAGALFVDDARASAAYRRAVVGVVAERAAFLASERLGE